MKRARRKIKRIALIIAAGLILNACSADYREKEQVISDAQALLSKPASEELEETYQPDSTSDIAGLDEVPDYSGDTYVAVNGNIPYFSETDYTTEAFEEYGDLDSLGRCTMAYACIGQDLMPTEERGEIGMIKPSGWWQNKYDFVDGKYLYNRCHLIAYCLTGENANEKNLITGTRYLNTEGMLPFENLVADYVKDTGNHVLYRVTPVFEENNLLADGVLMEGWSVEDDGSGICFNAFVYNEQPGIEIDYTTGENWLAGSAQSADESLPESEKTEYILNTNTRKFHLPSCESAQDTNPQNRKEYTGSRNDLITEGYSPCNRCKP